jgi:hypothetical protein
MTETEKIIAFMVERDVVFAVRHASPGGQREVSIQAGDLGGYLADPAAWMALHYGVSKAEYLGWHASGYCVRCAGKTAQGKSCKATVTGLTLIESPKKWAQHQGEYCLFHGGNAKSEKVR